MSVAPVSVIVPVFNGKETLMDALKSIAAQTLLPAEVVIVDDGSTDGSGAVAEGFVMPKGVKKIVVRQENMGLANARNSGIAAAGQAWVALLDADDMWLPEKLAQCAEVMANGRIDLVCHDFYRVRDGEIKVVASSKRMLRGANVFTALYLRNFLCASTAVIRRSALMKVGGFRPGMRRCEDYDLWLRLLAVNPKGLAVVAEALAYWQDSPGSLSKNVWKLYAATLAIAWRNVRAVWRLSPWPLWMAVWRVGLIHGQVVRDLLRAVQPGRYGFFTRRYFAKEW